MEQALGPWDSFHGTYDTSVEVMEFQCAQVALDDPYNFLRHAEIYCGQVPSGAKENHQKNPCFQAIQGEKQMVQWNHQHRYVVSPKVKDLQLVQNRHDGGGAVEELSSS